MSTETALIYQRIASIIDELGAIEKNKTNVEQKFKYRGIDQFYNALHPLFAKHKVFTVPEILDRIEQPHVTKSGTSWRHVVVRVKYTFFAEDGSSFQSVVFGEGLDSGDKATNKALAVAHKYCLLQVFCVATEDMEDPDEHTAPERAEEAKASRKQLDDMAAVVKRIQQHLPDTEIITLRKLYKEGCSETRYQEWMEHLKQIETGMNSVPAGKGGNGKEEELGF